MRFERSVGIFYAIVIIANYFRGCDLALAAAGLVGTGGTAGREPVKSKNRMFLPTRS